MSKILLTGASGYVGGKLLKRLEFDGHPVRCLVRNPERLKQTGPSTEVVQGDVRDSTAMAEACRGIETAYYLVHALADRKNFESHEIEAAQTFAAAARDAGVSRIIYLGGLGRADEHLSPHLKSRQNVGSILRNSGIATIEFRASIILGAGSLSFEMLRSLTEHLPVMVMPRWVSTKAQPIGIYDVVEYLVQAINVDLDESRIIEIGGTEQLSYRDLMCEYAAQKKLKRLMISVPVLTPWLSSKWLGLVTPLYASVGRKLIESIRNPTVVENTDYQNLFNVHLTGAHEAMREAILESEAQWSPEEEVLIYSFQPAGASTK